MSTKQLINHRALLKGLLRICFKERGGGADAWQTPEFEPPFPALDLELPFKGKKKARELSYDAGYTP